MRTATSWRQSQRRLKSQEEKAMDECEEIKGLFQGRKLRKDDKVLIWWSPNKGKFEIGVVEVCRWSSRPTTRSGVFEVYCGDDPVSPSAFQSFVAGAAALEPTAVGHHRRARLLLLFTRVACITLHVSLIY